MVPGPGTVTADAPRSTPSTIAAVDEAERSEHAWRDRRADQQEAARGDTSPE